MSDERSWWLVIYDVREPKRWRKVYRMLRGRGEHLQLSVFRCDLNRRQFERLRWELEKVLAAEDSILFAGLCASCVERVVARNRPEAFPDPQQSLPFKIV